MLTIEGKTYAHILNGLVHWIFSHDDLPEYNASMFTAVDITNLSPAPAVGWTATQTNGAWSFAPPTVATVTWPQYQTKALSVLAESDVTMNRITEAVALGLTSFTTADVVTFITYRRSLRTIIAAPSGDVTQPLPTKPPYPSGS